MISILIADDHPIFRQGLALTLKEAEDFKLCGEVGTAEDAYRSTVELKPDLLLLDLSMPGGGQSVIEQIVREAPDTHVVVLTASEDSVDLSAAISAGASGYIVKGVGGRSLINILRDIRDGQHYITPSLATRVLGELAQGSTNGEGKDPLANAQRQRLEALTPREREIMALVATGCSNRRIAEEIGIQEKTVKHHMTRILAKLKAANRTEAAMQFRDYEEAMEET
jgi:two-component system, NarL family, nitrate/nitrite response regulator NarL